jgi:hypothetical protein
MLDAENGFVFAGLVFGVVQFFGQGFVQDVAHQGGFARPRDARHRHKKTQGKP